MTEYQNYVVEFRFKTVTGNFGTPEAAVKSSAKTILGNCGYMEATEYDIAKFIEKHFYSVVRVEE